MESQVSHTCTKGRFTGELHCCICTHLSAICLSCRSVWSACLHICLTTGHLSAFHVCMPCRSVWSSCLPSCLVYLSCLHARLPDYLSCLPACRSVLSFACLSTCLTILSSCLSICLPVLPDYQSCPPVFPALTYCLKWQTANPPPPPQKNKALKLTLAAFKWRLWQLLNGAFGSH